MIVKETDTVSAHVLTSSVDGLSPDDISVEFSPDFNRATDSDVERIIEETWEHRQRENPHLFNGKKFRLHQVMWEPGSKPIFLLGLTTYRDYLGTNCSQKSAEIRDRGLRLADSNPQAFMSDALGVGALLCTKDCKFVFQRRSQICGEAQGLIDVPGGHPEPEMVPLLNASSNEGINHAIRAELFNSILKEVIDEVNIQQVDLSEPRLLGYIKNKTTAERASLEFLIRCQLTSEEIEKKFCAGTQAEANESTAIYFLTKKCCQRPLPNVGTTSHRPRKAAFSCIIKFKMATCFKDIHMSKQNINK